MNKTSIKNYAIWARNELISRVSQKVFEYGVEKDNVLPYDAQSINGRLLSDDEKKKRQILINEVKHKGYDQVIEEVAYTWFNRLIALRFMEVNNYLPDKVRLFTNEYNEFKPQIIDEALHIELSGLDKNKIIALKEASNNEELYKELLLATCNDMSRYLPGMFKPISDYMTLLFPSNLLREESVLGRLINDIDEDSWTDQVQIIGWLYQYYNTEPKDTAFAALKKNIKINKNTIAPATQLFTPDWIVRYMTENSLGRLWLDGHTETDIKSNWKYYLDEAEQEESVKIELNKIKAEHAKLRPEDIKFIDPCMGSGHILVYAFDVFMQIYVSEGWTEREAAISILQNNLYGLDIDERAYQLSYFALMMKARQYNRRVLSEGIIPNVMGIEESNTFNKELLRRFGDLQSIAERIANIFIDAKEYGSILNVEFTKEELDSLEDRLNEIDKMSDYGNLLDQMESDQLFYEFYPLLKQARIMSQKYECVVTNPPYMGANGMNTKLGAFIKRYYPCSKADLFAVFIEKCASLTKEVGYQAMITQHSWMFLTSFEELRKKIMTKTISCMVHLGTKAFDPGEVGTIVQTTSFVLWNYHNVDYMATYARVVEYQTSEDKELAIRKLETKNRFVTSAKSMSTVPNSIIAYWLSNEMIKTFIYNSIQQYCDTKKGILTGNNDKFIRFWHEVSNKNIGFRCDNYVEMKESNYKWFPITSGGYRRKWYGNYTDVVNLADNGYAIKNEPRNNYRLRENRYYCQPAGTWSEVAGNHFSIRYVPRGVTFGNGGPCLFSSTKLLYIIGLLNSKVANAYLAILAPTLNFGPDQIKQIPLLISCEDHITQLVNDNIAISKRDWDSFETSWDFNNHPLVKGLSTIMESFTLWDQECTVRFNQMKANEEELNRIFIDVYGLQNELTPEVDDKDITVHKADLQREIKSLVSYAVGCMFGRYSLDVDGLAYAGGEWNDSRYKSFLPDKDNIIPSCDDEYFNDDITERFIEFIKAAYGKDTLEENLRYIADALGGKGTSREVIRSYFINDFYIDHVKVYQKRPIYWQFDSGKKNGFKALVYIHRYTPDLIARMRTSYVHEQQSRYENQISMIQNHRDSATSTSERVKAEKELKKLKEQVDELRMYEEKIHHWADKMEPMDLDDGVKANYAKFQELLTKIK